jgi:hypothetical protein
MQNTLISYRVTVPYYGNGMYMPSFRSYGPVTYSLEYKWHR